MSLRYGITCPLLHNHLSLWCEIDMELVKGNWCCKKFQMNYSSNILFLFEGCERRELCLQ